MNDLRLRLSIGLVAVLLLHACIVVIGLRAPTQFDHGEQIKSFSFDSIESNIRNDHKVNASARDEIKRQSNVCVPCGGVVIAQTTPPIQAPQPQAPAKRFNLDLFVSSDAQYQQLLNWFNEDPELAKIKAKCNYQVYAPGNALYKARYSDIVPVSQFPAITLTKENGGYVYVGSRDQIPKTATGVYNALVEGARLANAATKPILLEATSSNLSCPDGNCDLDRNRKPLLPWKDPNREPVDSVLFPTKPDASGALISHFFRQSGIDLGVESVVLIDVLMTVRSRSVGHSPCRNIGKTSHAAPSAIADFVVVKDLVIKERVIKADEHTVDRFVIDIHCSQT